MLTNTQIRNAKSGEKLKEKHGEKQGTDHGFIQIIPANPVPPTFVVARTSPESPAAPRPPPSVRHSASHPKRNCRSLLTELHPPNPVRFMTKQFAIRRLAFRLNQPRRTVQFVRCNQGIGFPLGIPPVTRPARVCRMLRHFARRGFDSILLTSQQVVLLLSRTGTIAPFP